MTDLTFAAGLSLSAQFITAAVMAFLLAGGVPTLPKLEAVKAPKIEAPQVNKAGGTDWGKVFEQWKAELNKANKEGR